MITIIAVELDRAKFRFTGNRSMETYSDSEEKFAILYLFTLQSSSHIHTIIIFCLLQGYGMHCQIKIFIDYRSLLIDWHFWSLLNVLFYILKYNRLYVLSKRDFSQFLNNGITNPLFIVIIITRGKWIMDKVLGNEY